LASAASALDGLERGPHVHFRWMRARRRSLLAWLRRRRRPADVLRHGAAFIRNPEPPNDVQARVAIVVACAALAWTLWRALDAGRLCRPRRDDQASAVRLLRFALPVSR
jgi:hypothetical protein